MPSPNAGTGYGVRFRSPRRGTPARRFERLPADGQHDDGRGQLGNGRDVHRVDETAQAHRAIPFQQIDLPAGCVSGAPSSPPQRSVSTSAGAASVKALAPLRRAAGAVIPRQPQHVLRIRRDRPSA
ncbi:MAG: hypothetical protein IPK17_22415 [Chloroflexi bacterium]|uniref:hypothetical protein n=1 Tax=Candidatus Flexifilum breve TaxID=3140694 RepID=UPI003134B7C0|nr:hypothetical protein [Chloroflexota bacterium]